MKITQGCICGPDLFGKAKRRDDGSYYDHAINPRCLYHQAAAADPENHSYPWNCPTFWDGCNCADDAAESGAA